MAQLFEVDVRTVNEHLKNIYEQGEITSEATIRKFRIVQVEGNRKVGNSVVRKYRITATDRKPQTRFAINSGEGIMLKSEHHFNNLRHIQHHVGQLADRVRNAQKDDVE